MNPLVRHFVPSVMRGVYRLDDVVTGQIDGDEYRRFIERKIALIPRHLAKEIGVQSAREQARRLPIELIPGPRAVALPNARGRAVEFFRHHDYFSNALNGNTLAREDSLAGSQNFLEIQFVKKILVPSLSDDGLRLIRPQEQVGGYLVDFGLCGTRKFALEVDGFGKFQQQIDLDNFIKRQNHIAAAGWTVIRYTYGQIMKSTESTVRNFCSILASDAQLNGMLGRQPAGAQAHLFDDTADDFGRNPIDRVNDFHRVQDFFADFCATQWPDRKEVVVRDDFKGSSSFVAVAISGLYEWLDAVAGIVDVDFNLPDVQVCGPLLTAGGNFRLHAKVTVAASDQYCDMVIDQRAILYGTAAVPVPPDAESRKIDYRHGLSVDDIHLRLSYFTEHIFGYAAGTKKFQDLVLQRVFDDRHVLGISTTGSGKSFCFWLPGILRPGLTIVVAPLRSLMRDQILSLRNNGIAVAEFINVDVTEPARRRIMEEARLGFVRLLYVAPERLRIKQFLDQLADLTQSVPINLLAIDEAHCISEWGHDFRPSYLKLPMVRESLSCNESPLKLIALTATAGREVEADMLGILQLRKGDGHEGDVIRDKAADRERFSYQIVLAENGSAKTKLFRKVLKEHIPKALNTTPLRSLLDKTNNSGEKALGIVFCIYANPHGRHTTHEGTAHYLYEAMDILEKADIFEPNHLGPDKYRLDAYSTGRVRVFSSTKPTLCPHCNSYDFTSTKGTTSAKDDLGEDDTGKDDGTGLKTCLHCGRDFTGSATKSPPTWNKVIKQNQEDFKSTRFDMLVATKGFGMGIDQSSVRFVLHTASSSGLESWYQEIGRAGRDEERAHIALLTEPPNNACTAALAKGELPIPDCKSYRSGCPHGKAGLCDYGKQHMFVKGSYPGVVKDAFRSMRMLDRILEARQVAMNGPVTVRSSHDSISSDEIVLYRLTVLGLVNDYVISYKPHPHFLVELTLSEVPARQELLGKYRKGMQQKLRDYLSPFQGTQIARFTITQKIEKCCKEFGQLEAFPEEVAKLNVLRELTPLFGQTASEFVRMVFGHLLVLLEHTYDRVVKMRYDMLRRLLDVVTSQECLRIAILDYFSQAPEKGYRCGLCDVCAPDLNFPDIRNPPRENPTNQELERRLERIYAEDPGSFDLKVLRELIHEFKDYPTAKYRQARTVVQGSPNNLSALFVAREFSPPAEIEGNARRLLRTANASGISLAVVKDLYTTSPDYLKADMLVSILNDAYSACDTAEGWEFLAREASIPAHRQTASVGMMGECLEFFVIAERVISEGTHSFKQKVLELEAAYD